MKMNPQLNEIPQSATVALFDRVKALQAAGKEIIPLHVGDPDFATHPAIIEAACQSLQNGSTHYANSRGIPQLREAINKSIQNHSNADYDPASEILVTHGGIHAYYTALKSVLSPGDEVIVPDPSWASHTNMVTLLGGKAVRVDASAENNFLPETSDWESAVTSKTKALVINFPANPTGVYPSVDYLKALHQLAEDHQLWIISDEVYQHLYYEEKPVSAAAYTEGRKHTILVNSLSKTYAMTGWRVGYVAAPQKAIDKALKASQLSITCVAPFIQNAAVTALTDPEVQTAVKKMRAEYKKRRQLILDLATEYPQSPIKVQSPKGAFYFFLDCRALRTPSVQICDELLEETGVSLVPGSAFGVNGEDFFRMSFASSSENIQEGFRRIMAWAERKTAG